ncbi:hypothetical protein EBR21_05385 [bacterium]|nr:hypothetical protein [bacterium]
MIVLGMTRVVNSDRGQYVGTCVGRFLSGTDQAFTRFFHQKGGSEGLLGQGIDEFMCQLAKWTGDRLCRLGLSGAFGIDSFVFRDQDGQLKLYPMIEINPRHTMGRVALALAKRMLPGRTGLWLHVSKSWLQKLGATSFSELKKRWENALPLRSHSSSGGVVILSGLLETTPAEQCSQVWTCFLVSQDLPKDLLSLGMDEIADLSGFGLKVDKPGMPL